MHTYVVILFYYLFISALCLLLCTQYNIVLCSTPLPLCLYPPLSMYVPPRTLYRQRQHLHTVPRQTLHTVPRQRCYTQSRNSTKQLPTYIGSTQRLATTSDMRRYLQRTLPAPAHIVPMVHTVQAQRTTANSLHDCEPSNLSNRIRQRHYIRTYVCTSASSSSAGTSTLSPSL